MMEARRIMKKKMRAPTRDTRYPVMRNQDEGITEFRVT